jgi:hypothetical protein
MTPPLPGLRPVPSARNQSAVSRTGRIIAVLSLAGALSLAAVSDGDAHRDAPPTAQTGGFGEATCQSCHFQAPANQGTGSLVVTGIPARYVEGETHIITITLSHAGMAVAGFQVSARFTDGTQAGTLAIPAAEQRRAAVTTDGGIQYGHHLYDGTLPTAPDSARWTLTWTAPAGSASVIFHAVANAGDNDESPLGDWVYATTCTCGPGTRC